MKNIILIVCIILMASCSDVQEGTIHRCKNCSKTIADNTIKKSAIFWQKSKISEDLTGYCENCGVEMIPYKISHVCEICKRIYQTETAEAQRKMELSDKSIDGICPDNNCKKVTVTNLLQVYNDLAGEGLKGKYTDVTRDKIWREEYFHKYVVAKGSVKNVSKEIFGERIYIHVQLSTSHYVDIYVKSSEKSKLEKIQKDTEIEFTGRLTELGSGIMFSHEIDNAEIITDL